MLKRHLNFTLIFLVIFLANLVAEFKIINGLNLWVKPLICISLSIYLFRTVKMRSGFNRLILFALILSLIGDVFLLFAGSSIYFFAYGLVAFVVVHVLYSLAFFRDFKNNPQASKVYGHLMLFAIGSFSLSFYSWIREYLNDLRVPVMVYIFVLSMMAILAGYRYQRVNMLSFGLIYLGAIFFVISDSLLAYNKFVNPFEISGLLIMGTYMVAQYLITMGAIERIPQIRAENKSVA